MHHKSVKEASAGDVIGFNVINVTGDSPIAAGMVCGDPEVDPPRGCESFVAHVVRQLRLCFLTIFSHTSHVPCMYFTALHISGPTSG